MTKEEHIFKLRKGIESESTPESARQSMRERIEELEAPEPEPIIEPIHEHVKPKKKPVDLSTMPHSKYMAENNLEFKALPVEIRKKINGLRMFMGKDSERVRAKAPEISNNIIEMIKLHLTPPPPPPPPPPPLKEYSVEEKQEMLEKYKKHRQRKKETII